jgi:hypothetical protein
MVSIQKRKTKSGRVSYRILVRVRGCPGISATFNKSSDAVKSGQEREAEFRLNRHFGFTLENINRILSKVMDQYRSQVLPHKKDIAIQTIQLNWWKAQIGSLRLCDISPYTIFECRQILQRGNTHYRIPRSATTVNRYLATISHVYTIAWREWNWINHNPVLNIKKLKEPRGRVRFLN